MTDRSEPGRAITPDLSVLEVIHRHRPTEAVFKAYEAQTGHCICCEALFDPLNQVADRYGLDLETLLDRLCRAAEEEPLPA